MECDMCQKDKEIIPTGLGGYVGEENPNLCKACKKIITQFSEPVIKLMIWELQKLKGNKIDYGMD